MYTSKYFVQSFDACVAARLFQSLDWMCPAGTIHGNHGFSMRWIVPSVQSGGEVLSLLKIHNLEQVSLLQVPDIQKETYFILSSCWSAHLSPDKLCWFKGMLNPCKGGFCSGERKIGQYSCTSQSRAYNDSLFINKDTSMSRMWWSGMGWCHSKEWENGKDNESIMTIFNHINTIRHFITIISHCNSVILQTHSIRVRSCKKFM